MGALKDAMEQWKDLRKQKPQNDKESVLLRQELQNVFNRMIECQLDTSGWDDDDRAAWEYLDRWNEDEDEDEDD